MAHPRTCEVQQLLHNKFVVVIGDSIQRNVYKDLVLLLQKDCLLSSSQLKAQAEPSFEQDVLLESSRRGRRSNGAHYREVRQFCSGHHLVRFYFLTRVYSHYIVDILEELQQGEPRPDLIIMNSCIWDLARYGENFRRGYRDGLQRLFGFLDRVLPVSCLLVWNTAMPVAEVVYENFLPTELQLQSTHLWEDVIEANFYSSTEASRHGFDVLDLHFYFRHAGQHRQRDGVHWDEHAHRQLSLLLLAHVADAWGVDFPCRRPESRRVRDGPTGGRQRLAEGRHPRDNRGDPDERALCWRPPRPRSTSYRRQPARSASYRRHPPRSTSYRSPRRLHSQPRRLLPNYRQDSHGSSHSSSQRPHFSNDSSWRHVEYTREVNLRVSPEPHLGPSRRASTQHRSRGSPPYPARSPSRPHRYRRRHTDRETEEWRSRTYT